MTEDSLTHGSGLKSFRLNAEEIARMTGVVNHALGDEGRLKERIAIVRQGERLTDRLAITAERDWFNPMLADLLHQGISVVVNDIPITETIAAMLGARAEVPPDWVTQQNLYITPQESQGFDPHCDPHVVIVAHLHGRKEWTIFDKCLDNPVYDSDTNTIAGTDETLGVRTKITVEPGDCFVIPRGLYHSAVALSPASVHLAIGLAGARPVDHLWTMAETALQNPTMRGDMTPDEAAAMAREFIGGYAVEPIPLPRFHRAGAAADRPASSFSFGGVLDAL